MPDIERPSIGLIENDMALDDWLDWKEAQEKLIVSSKGRMKSATDEQEVIDFSS